MSVLDKASLVQIPSGYKSTKLYSQIPSNGNGDFTFARSSSGTRVNSEGLIETAQVVSTTELVTNGDFATDTDWNKGNKWTISGGTANRAANTTSNISQVISGISGKKIQVIFTVSNYGGSGGVGASANGNDYTQNSANGTFTEYITPTSDNFYIRASYAFVGSIDNVSVKEVIENDVPRLDYSDGSCASLLLEGQSTNLVTYSEDFSDSSWTNSLITVTANATTSPDGTLNADKLLNGVGSSHIGKSLTVTNGVDYTLTTFVKKVDNDVFQQQIFNSGYTEKVYLYFTFSTETITITDTVTGTSYISSAFKDMGNGWYKITLTIEAFDTTLRIRNRIGSENTGADNASLYIWGAMLEQSSYATSYIKTTSATATRTADVCNNAGTAATFNSTEGVLFAEIAALADDLTNRGFSLSDGTSNNACRIYYSNSSNNIRFFFNVGGNAQVIKSVNLTDITDYNKIAFSYKQDDFKIYINGVKVEEDTSGSVPSANTFSKLSFDRGYGGENFYGKVKQLMVFNEELSDSELATLTS